MRDSLWGYSGAIGRSFFVVSLFFTFLLVGVEASATGGAFNYTKHGGGTTDGDPPYNVGNGSGVDRSVNTEHYSGANHYNEFSLEAGRYKAGECPQCHELHASFGGSEPYPRAGSDEGPDAFLGLNDYGSSTTNYSNLCWYCHQYFSNINGEGSPVTMGKFRFYQGQTIYEASSHYNANQMYWPGDDLGSAAIWPRKSRQSFASGNRGSCVNCHTPHGIMVEGSATALDTSAVPSNKQTTSSNLSVSRDYLIPRQLIAWEEALCERCHDGSPATSDIQSEINKRHFFGQSGHPIDDTSLAGNHVASESLPITTRHVECYDCHNPHAAGDPGVGGSRLQGMKYIDINGINRDPTAGDPQPMVHEVCFRCHGDSFDCIMPYVAKGAETSQVACNDGPPRNRGNELVGMGFNRQLGASNKRKEFNSSTPVTLDHGADGAQTNGAWHPVGEPGRNRSVQLCNQLKDAFNLVCVDGNSDGIADGDPLGSLTINCTDCHNNDATGAVTTRGPVTESNLRSTDDPSVYVGSEPVGPHGSSNARILRANYNTRIGTGGAVNSVGESDSLDSNFALCFLCHDSTPFKEYVDSTGGACTGSTNGVNNCEWTNFYSDEGTGWGASLHNYHLRKEMTDGRKMKCHECHNNMHSNVEANNTQFYGGDATQIYPLDGNTHLLNFGPNIFPDSFPKPALYWDTAAEVFACNMKCHGNSMSSCSYRGKADGGPGGDGTC